VRIPLDDQAQPTLHSRKEVARINDRKIDEMIGICKGIISDQVITSQEIEFLCQWMINNTEIANTWPASILYQRIEEMLKDNVLNQNEKNELFETLRQITGSIPDADAKNMAIKLPLTDPLPVIVFKDQKYCLTGHFVTGTRKQVESIIVQKGGYTHKNPTLDTDYLVIGLMGSADWIHSSFGRKIERAVEIQRESHIKIVSEEYWMQFI